MKKLIIYIFIILNLLNTLIIFNCTDNKPEPITVKNVYYGHYYHDVAWNDLSNDWITEEWFVISVEFDDGYNPDQYSYINWLDFCTPENNEFISESGPGNNIPQSDFSLRLKYPYDLTSDIGKKVFFKDKVFRVTAYSGGEFGITDSFYRYISTKSKEINFSYYK